MLLTFGHPASGLISEVVLFLKFWDGLISGVVLFLKFWGGLISEILGWSYFWGGQYFWGGLISGIMVLRWSYADFFYVFILH